MKRIILAVLGGLMVFGSVFGMAAGLGGLNSNRLGAEDATVATCDTDGVTTDYAVAYNTSGTAGYKVDTVTVSGIAVACNGQTMKVTLTGAGNTPLAEATGPVAVAGGDTSDNVSFLSSNVLAENVTGIHVVISG